MDENSKICFEKLFQGLKFLLKILEIDSKYLEQFFLFDKIYYYFSFLLLQIFPVY